MIMGPMMETCLAARRLGCGYVSCRDKFSTGYISHFRHAAAMFWERLGCLFRGPLAAIRWLEFVHTGPTDGRRSHLNVRF